MEEKKRENKGYLTILFFFIMTLFSNVFATLCIYKVKVDWIKNYSYLWIGVSVLILLLLYGVCGWCVLKKKESWIKTLISAYVLLVFCLVHLTKYRLFRGSGKQGEFASVFGKSRGMDARRLYRFAIFTSSIIAHSQHGKHACRCSVVRTTQNLTF